MRLSVIFPAYNEAENIKLFPVELVPHLRELGVDYEIILIDDGSKDDTSIVVKSLNITEMKVFRQESNQGLGAAVRLGIKEASGELLVMMDTDLTFHPRYIKDLLARYNQGDVDFVIGSPKLAGWSSDIAGYRRFISKCASMVYSMIFGRRITAVTPIFRLYKTADLKAMTLESTKFDIVLEILFKLHTSTSFLLEAQQHLP